MTQYITLDVKLSNSQLNKLKSEIKNVTKEKPIHKFQRFVKLLQMVH